MKKLVSLVLIISILASSCLALGSIDTDANAERVEPVNAIGLTEAQMADIAASLQEIESVKEEFGLADVHFPALAVGDEIKAYEMLPTGISSLGFSLYPLLSSDDTIVAFAIKHGSGANAMTTQIDTGLVDEINHFLESSTSIALVYDRIGCYAYNGETIQLIFTNSEENTLRARLLPTREITHTFESVSVSACSPRYIVYDACSEYAEPMSTNYTAITLSVPVVSQRPYSKLCWAACMSAIGRYFTGIDYTIEELSEHEFGPGTYIDGEYYAVNQGLDIESTIARYEEDYELGFSGRDAADVDAALIYENLSTADEEFNKRGRPLHAQFMYYVNTGKVYHAAIIYGMNSSGTSITVREPTNGTHYASFVNGLLTFVSTSSGMTLTLEKALVKMDYWNA